MVIDRDCLERVAAMSKEDALQIKDGESYAPSRDAPVRGGVMRQLSEGDEEDS